MVPDGYHTALPFLTHHSTTQSNPDSFHPSSSNPQDPTALYSPFSNDAYPLTDHRNPRQAHRSSRRNTQSSNTTPLTESNLEEHSRQISLLLGDPDYATRNFGQERRDIMAAALQSLGQGDLPEWVIKEMAKRV